MAKSEEQPSVEAVKIEKLPPVPASSPTARDCADYIQSLLTQEFPKDPDPAVVYNPGVKVSQF